MTPIGHHRSTVAARTNQLLYEEAATTIIPGAIVESGTMRGPLF
jgi:hypothetical protein